MEVGVEVAVGSGQPGQQEVGRGETERQETQV